MDYSKASFEQGQVLLINKPLDWTSFDVVNKLRYILKVKKIGHAGTLDPLATGLLIICTGKFTKKITEYMAQEKEYTGEFTLGATTPTYDLESSPVDFHPYEHITRVLLEETTRQFTGTIQQVPPAHSAIKVNGVRVYELAREGREVKLDPRTVTITAFEIVDIALPRVSFRVVCTTGTYIRSLAHDFGQALGCGAYLSKLCRTRIGAFQVTDALSLEGLQEKVKQARSENKGIADS